MDPFIKSAKAIKTKSFLRDAEVDGKTIKKSKEIVILTVKRVAPWKWKGQL